MGLFMISKRQAESFRLYRHLPQQFAFASVWDEQDILWAAPDEVRYVTGNGLPIFHHKTQGYPYHLALLAVGILLENRFPYSNS